MKKTCFCGISEYCGYQIETDMEQHDKVKYEQGYMQAIDDFAEKIKERLKGMQMVELQGEDVCPYAENGKECPYMNLDIGCQYCAREQTIKDIDEIAEQLKAKLNLGE